VPSISIVAATCAGLAVAVSVGAAVVTMSQGANTTATPAAVQGACTNWECARLLTTAANTTLPYPIAKAIYALDEHEAAPKQ
jgi:hypothetical protein